MHTVCFYLYEVLKQEKLIYCVRNQGVCCLRPTVEVADREESRTLSGVMKIFCIRVGEAVTWVHIYLSNFLNFKLKMDAYIFLYIKDILEL